MGPRPLPHFLPAELLILVGKIAVQSAYVDLLIGDVLGGLKNINDIERSKKIHILDTRRKIQEAQEILKSPTNDPDHAALLAVLVRAADMLADRNLVLHGIIGYQDEDYTTPRFYVFRGKYLGDSPPVSRETLEPIFTELDEISQELMAVCLKRGYTALSPSRETPQ